MGAFPRGPVVRIQSFHCRGPRAIPSPGIRSCKPSGLSPSSWDIFTEYENQPKVTKKLTLTEPGIFNSWTAVGALSITSRPSCFFLFLLTWVFIAACWLSLVVLYRLLLLQSWGSRALGSGSTHIPGSFFLCILSSGCGGSSLLHPGFLYLQRLRATH